MLCVYSCGLRPSSSTARSHSFRLVSQSISFPLWTTFTVQRLFPIRPQSVASSVSLDAASTDTRSTLVLIIDCITAHQPIVPFLFVARDWRETTCIDWPRSLNSSRRSGRFGVSCIWRFTGVDGHIRLCNRCHT